MTHASRAPSSDHGRHVDDGESPCSSIVVIKRLRALLSWRLWAHLPMRPWAQLPLRPLTPLLTHCWQSCRCIPPSKFAETIFAPIAASQTRHTAQPSTLPSRTSPHSPPDSPPPRRGHCRLWRRPASAATPRHASAKATATRRATPLARLPQSYVAKGCSLPLQVMTGPPPWVLWSRYRVLGCLLTAAEGTLGQRSVHYRRCGSERAPSCQQGLRLQYLRGSRPECLSAKMRSRSADHATERRGRPCRFIYASGSPLLP